MENMPRDEEIHLDLAILIIKALFDASIQGTYNTSSYPKGFLTHALLAADKKLFCQTLSRLYFPDDADENKIRTLKFLMNSFKQVFYSAPLSL
jgi:condensin complex subunit 3